MSIFSSRVHDVHPHNQSSIQLHNTFHEEVGVAYFLRAPFQRKTFAKCVPFNKFVRVWVTPETTAWLYMNERAKMVWQNRINPI